MKNFFPRRLDALLLLGMIVILWGAWVRISHSGDGCGASWPLCAGEYIPGLSTVSPPKKTWVEWTHRLLSGIFGICVFVLFVRSFLSQRSGTIRIFSSLALFFTITEALLGAKLVLSNLVGMNDSFARLFFMALHLLNSLFLMGTLYTVRECETDLRGHPEIPRRRLTLICVFLGIAVTGSWAALSNTLFPTSDFFQAIRDDFSGAAHPLVQLRIWHPLLASLFAGGFGYYFFERRETFMGSLFCLAGLSGFANLIFHAPILLKLTHLALVYLLWFSILHFACPRLTLRINTASSRRLARPRSVR